MDAGPLIERLGQLRLTGRATRPGRRRLPLVGQCQDQPAESVAPAAFYHGLVLGPAPLVLALSRGAGHAVVDRRFIGTLDGRRDGCRIGLLRLGRRRRALEAPHRTLAAIPDRLRALEQSRAAPRARPVVLDVPAARGAWQRVAASHGRGQVAASSPDRRP
jgi:hypothetical protein